MHAVLLTVHIIVSILLILVVLIQSGRSGGFSGLMGGGGGDALFSTSGQQSGLRQATWIIAIVFGMTSVGLTMLSNQTSNQSVFQKSFPTLPPVRSPEANKMPTFPETKDKPASGVQGMPDMSNPTQSKPGTENKK